MGSGKDEVEQALGRSIRIRILAALGIEPGTWQTAYSLGKRIGVKNPRVRENLKRLIRIGWVEEAGNSPRSYRLNPSSRRGQLFQEFLKKSDYWD